MNYGLVAAAGIGAALTFAAGYVIGLRLGWIAGFRAGAMSVVRKKRRG